jgi:Glucosamine 6-phosphate synthetase, contains amidotransferase and phosphosugar isomerase domains
VYDKDRNKVNRRSEEISWDVESASKEGYAHFMLKEIYQQPTAIKETIERRIDEEGNIVLENINITKEVLEKINKIYIVACGTAYHAGLIGKYLFQTFLKIDTIADIASEFRYSEHNIDENTLVVIVSQSGETADTLQALKDAKQRGARILSITNVVGSSIARESDDVFYTWAGPEIAVASTKAYTTQLVAFYLMALHFGRLKNTIELSCYKEILNELRTLPEKLQITLSECDEKAKNISEKIKDKQSVFI